MNEDNTPTPSRISFIVVPLADYSLDFMRFFYDNRRVLESHCVHYPFAETFIHQTFCQNDLNYALLAHANIDAATDITNAARKAILENAYKYINAIERIDVAQEILFIGHFWAIESYLHLLRLLGDEQKFPRLSKAQKRIVWINEARSSYVEGAYRNNHFARNADVQQMGASSCRRNAWWKDLGDQCLAAFPADRMQQFAAQDGLAINLDSVFRSLGYDFLDACAPPVMTGVSNRDAVAMSHWLTQWFSGDEHTQIMQVLRRIEGNLAAEENLTFLPPSILRALDGEAVGAAEAQTIDAAWHPHKDFFSKRFNEVLLLLMQACPPALRERIGTRANAHARCFAPEVAPVIEQIRSVQVGFLPEPALCVLTLTKNHAPFIAQCMDSVLAQQTRMPVRHIVVDDLSSDGTRSIISQYAKAHDSILPIYLPQYESIGENVRALFSACRSPYVALCDGDDYFVDPYKLQKQVDFLEANPLCGLCFHPVQVVYEDGTERERVYPPVECLPRGVSSSYYLADLLKANFIQTNSVMYRWRFINGLPEWFRVDLVPGDWYWHLLHAETGKIGFINEAMSVYRRHKKALFYSAETKGTSVPHRVAHGLSELAFFDAVNAHFKKRYERAITGFTNNILADFLQYGLQSGDSSLLDKAGEVYPDFMRVFVQNVQIRHVKGPGAGNMQEVGAE